MIPMRTLFAGTALILVATLAWAVIAASDAQAAIVLADGQAQRARSLADHIIALRQAADGTPIAQQGPDDIVSRLRNTMADAGLESGALRGVRPHAEEIVHDRERMQRVEVALAGVDAERFATWLQRWHAGPNPWQIQEIEIDPMTGTDSGRLQVGLVLVSHYTEAHP